MSVYEHDGRVRLHADATMVAGSPYDRKVVDGPLGWSVFEGPGLVLVSAGHASRDAAIRSLIGEPAVKA